MALTFFSQVFWVHKGAAVRIEKHRLWTPTTLEAPDLLYVDFVWDNQSRNEWFRSAHWKRLDLLSARAGALNLNIVKMPITLAYETDNYDNIRFHESLAAVALTYNASDYTYLGFLTDMTPHMFYVRQSQRNLAFWQGDKTCMAQFRMTSGQKIAIRLRAMWLETRPESFWFLRSIIRELVRGHDEWVANGGYTIEADTTLGEAITREYAAVVAQQEPVDTPGDRLQQLRIITGRWDANKRKVLQDYIDTAHSTSFFDLSKFLVFGEDWLSLSQEEKGMVIELRKLEHENDVRNALTER